MVKRNVLKKNTLALRYDDDFIQIESSSTLRNALHSFAGLTPEEVEDLFDNGDITIGRIKTARVEKECILRILGGSLHRILASEIGQPWDEVKYRLLKLFSHHTRVRDVIIRVLDRCVGKEVRVTIFSESLNASFHLDNDGLLQVNEQKNDRVVRVGGSIYRKRCSSWERYSRQTKEFERLEPLLVDGRPQFYADGTPKIVARSYKKVQVVWMPVDEDELHLLTASKHTDQG